jgi:hypothetical protein
MVQHQSGDESDNAYFKGTVTRVRGAGLKEILLTTLFQDTHLLKEMQIKIQTYKLFVFRVILRKGGVFLIGKRHP